MPFRSPTKTGNSCDFFNIIGECGSTFYVGLQHAVPPSNTKFKPLLLPSQAGMPFTNTHKHRTLYFKSTLTFLGPAKCWKSISSKRQNWEILAFFIMIIKDCGSTLYVGLARVVPPTNTKFKPLLLLIQAGITYPNTHKHRK